VLLACADEHDADIIVIGSHGISALGGLLGSVAAGVVHHAHRPVLVLAQGFGGVRDFGGRLALDPRRPAAWEALSFSLRFRDGQLRVELRHDAERFTLDHGEALDVTIRSTAHTLADGSPLTLAPTSSAPA
jgi:hypothetical protein